MKKKRFLTWGIAWMMFLTGCTAPLATEAPKTEPPAATPLPVEPTQPPTETPTEPAVEPTQVEPTSTPEAYPLPGELPISSSDPLGGIIPPYLLPQDGDEKLKREPVFIDLDQSGFVILESLPVQVQLHALGSLPTPCHELRAIITTSKEQNRVDVDLYSLVDPNMVCTTVLSPFSYVIPLGSFNSGKYSVYINGELFRDFEV